MTSTPRSTITFLGHSGVDLRLGAFRVVCDPWLTPRGAFLGRWNQFPDNGQVAAEALHDTPLLFVSSPRPDHFDADTLASFPRTTRVLLPAFPSPVLAERIRGLGFTDVLELADGQPHELGPNASVEIIKGPTAHVFGAVLVLSVGGEVVVNQNDCELDPATAARLAALAPAVHVASLSATARAAATYDVTPGPTTEQIDEQLSQTVGRFVAAARAVGARAVVVSGGPPCILDERGFELNFAGGLYTDADALASRASAEAPDLDARLRLVYPGDVARVEDGSWVIEGHRPYDDKRAYLEAYRARRAPELHRHRAELQALAAPVDGKQLRSYLRDFFQFEDMTWDLGVLIQLHLSEGPDTWIDFRKKPYRYNAEGDEAAGYVLTVDTAWASLVLQEKLTWHELLVAHEMTVRRAQDRECPGLLAHLEFRHDPALFELVRRLNPATITIQDEKMEYVCQRFCPHRGRDLEYAIVERGVLTCTAHGWRFDLRKGGRCLWGGETPLVVKEVRPLKP